MAAFLFAACGGENRGGGDAGNMEGAGTETGTMGGTTSGTDTSSMGASGGGVDAGPQGGASGSGSGNQTESGVTNSETGQSTLGDSVNQTRPDQNAPVTSKGDTVGQTGSTSGDSAR